ncbi:MAG: 30S ribosomal protein S20 [bacterium]
MPITSSAKKALRVASKKKIFNLRRSNTMKKSIRNFKKLVIANKIKEAEKILPEVYTAIDKASKTKLIKKNTGSRYKSRITLFLNKVKAKK